MRNSCLNYGSALFELGKVQEAKHAFETALKVNPKSDTAYYSLGVLADSQNDFKQAVDLYTHATKLNSHNESAFLNLGAAYANLQQFDKALDSLNKALTLNPNDSEVKSMITRINKK